MSEIKVRLIYFMTDDSNDCFFDDSNVVNGRYLFSHNRSHWRTFRVVETIPDSILQLANAGPWWPKGMGQLTVG